MSKKPITKNKPAPKKVVKKVAKKVIKPKPKTNDEAKLSNPMQAGLAAVEAMPKPPKEGTKLAKLIELLKRPEGATIDQIIEMTSWQKHTARAAISHELGKKRGYQIVSEKPKDGARVYKITES